jgi:hypothetical protein
MSVCVGVGGGWGVGGWVARNVKAQSSSNSNTSQFDFPMLTPRDCGLRKSK